MLCQVYLGIESIDFAINGLYEKGYLHNHSRMYIASIACNIGKAYWLTPSKWMYYHLLDGDIASNVGGWQWAASTGTDAQPWFRVFNPVAQGMKFDPAGSFVREWLPELQNVPDKFIHAPWLMSYSETTWLGFQLGRDYPNPIVDHGVQRLLALDMFKKVALTREPS